MLNTVSLLGRFVADPELRHTPNGIPVTTFTLAVNRNYVKKGEDRETDFIDIVCWRGTAEFVCKYFKKGSQAAITGSIQTRSYEEKDTGKKRKVFEIVADNVYFAEGRKNMDINIKNDSDFSFVTDDDDLPF